MVETATSYVFQTPQGGWRIVGTRVSLDSIIHCYWEGLSPEAIVAAFPSLRAEQVYGAIAFYLRNREEMDHYLEQERLAWEEDKARSDAKNKPLLDRLRAARAARTQPANP
jgi:uncharacterized protein (DUF433 family)